MSAAPARRARRRGLLLLALALSILGPFALLLAALPLPGGAPPGSPAPPPRLAGRPAPASPAPATEAPPPCTEKHWALNLLADAGAGRVDFAPRRATVADLGALPRPEGLAEDVRAFPEESVTYRVEAELKAFSLRGDGDIDVVIEDPVSGGTMVAEFPDAGCREGARSPRRVEIAAARGSLLAACGPAPAREYRKLDGRATFVGVALFDEPKGQKGAAPNGLELHPVIAVEAIDCRPQR